jgi:hypothetical protein
MALFMLAAALAAIGLILAVAGYLGETDMGTKTWSCLCFISAAIVLIIKYCITQTKFKSS